MANHNALVSIVVPIYGTEAYLHACIDSICNQSYSNLQIILVDDQSPDNCPAICDDYAQKDNRVIAIHQKNTGVSGARNTGMIHALGEYIMFVDSDDELLPHAVELLVEDIVRFNADIASASKTHVTKNGVLCHSDNGETHIYEGEEMIRRSLQYDNRTRSLHAKLFLKEFLHDIRFVEGHNINEDGYFLFECYTKLPKVVQHEVSVYKYYHREGSASNSNFSEKYLDMLYFCELKKKFICENMPSYLEHANDMEVRTNLLFLDVLCRSKDKKYIDVQRKCIETIRRLKAYHKPINRHYRRLIWIVAHGLYPVYKLAVRIKHYR